MNARIIVIPDLYAAEKEMQSIGVDGAGIKVMLPKALSRALKLKNIKPTPANIIKQEMLSIGGEAAVASGVIDHSVAAADILLLGTPKHFNLLVTKLRTHQFGLPQLADEIILALKNYDGVPASLDIKGKRFEFGSQTYIMGILNVTPDSFSDGNKYLDAKDAVMRARQMLAEGADIIDIGGESTRPGAEPVTAEEEIKRVVPVIERLAAETGAIISIDTYKAAVAKAALKAGASMINDISALRFDVEMAGVAAENKCPVTMMHILGTPRDMQKNPTYSDLMGEILASLEEGLAIGKRAGILLEQIIVDPGIGFGKTTENNLEIVKRLREIKVLGRPILIGVSRKAFIGSVLDLPTDERVEGTAAAVAVAIANGADFIRVHDVKEMKRVAKMVDAIVRNN
ncbi:MAG: dihydropteroate synthase [Candidatus Margulisiibacteriota bacterium]